MARGDSKSFAANIALNLGQGDYNLTTDTLSWVLVTNPFAAIDADATTSNLSSLTQVASGGNYAGVTNLTGVQFTQSGNEVTLDYDDVTFGSNASNPTTATCLVVFNNTSAADDLLKVTDLTVDGTTPVDLTQGFNFAINASGSITFTVDNS